MISALGGKEFEEPKWAGTQFRTVFHLSDITIELHRELLVDRGIDLLFIRNSRLTKVPGLDWIQEPCPEDLFLFLCGHGAFQHLFDRLFWLDDIRLLIENERNLDWEYVRLRTRRWKFEVAVGVTVGILRHHYGTSVPNLRLGSFWRTWLGVRFLSPERLRTGRHRRPRLIYLIAKALMRDSLLEVLSYYRSRTFFILRNFRKSRAS